MTAATADVTHVLAPGRVRMAAASVAAMLLGATPHVLHHAGAALVAGLGGTLLFGALGVVAATPRLPKRRRRSGSWRKPAAVLALFTTLFAVSSLVVAPVLTGAEDDTGPRLQETAPQGSNDDHVVHHPAVRRTK